MPLDDAQRLGRRVQHRAQLRRLALLGQRPRLPLLQVAVRLAHHAGQLGQPGSIRMRLDRLDHAARRPPSAASRKRALRPRRARPAPGSRPSQWLTDQLQHAAEHVAQVVGQVRVVAPHEGLLGEAGVLPQRHLGHQEVAEGVHAVLLGERPSG